MRERWRALLRSRADGVKVCEEERKLGPGKEWPARRGTGAGRAEQPARGKGGLRTPIVRSGEDGELAG